MNHEFTGLIIFIAFYTMLLALDWLLFKKRFKRYSQINLSIIENLEKNIKVQKELEIFLKSEVVEDIYKQVWGKIGNKFREVLKNEQ
jgi:hypothetical protein